MLHTPAFIYYSNHLILNFLLLNAILNQKKRTSTCIGVKLCSLWLDGLIGLLQIRSFIDAQLKEY